MIIIIFVCRRNSGRSQMATAYLKAILGESVDICCGDTEPTRDIDINVKRVMAEDGVSLERAVPQLLDAMVAARADRVIAMGCDIGDALDLPRVDEDWGVEDVDGLDLATVRAIRDVIKRRALGLADAIKRGELGARPYRPDADEVLALTKRRSSCYSSSSGRVFVAN
ncbi:MAG: low molecular weight phosphatase family protein [Vulcanimicrobiaceae bacterium]